MATTPVNIPSPPNLSDEELVNYLHQLSSAIRMILIRMNYSIADNWQPTNVPASGNRNIDGDSATLQETSRCLARLIQDLKDGGLISG